MNTLPSAAPIISVVVPVFNEEAGIQAFHDSLLLPELIQLGLEFEIVYVNDGSRDNTLEIIKRIAKSDPRVRVVALSRNFGKEIATTAGIHTARGEATVIMDGDGQHPPAMLPEFVEKWQNGAQVVVGIRTKNEKEGLVKRWGSKVFYALFNATSGATLVPRSTDFRLIDSEVREAFVEFPERQRIARALIDWLGFDREYIEFHSPERLAGEATYSVKQLTRLAINSYISLSFQPLYFFGWVGAAITLLSFLLGTFVFIEQFTMGDPLGLNYTGAALLGVFVAFMVGIVLISQAMIAAYMAHIHEQTQGRPLFVVNHRSSVNL